MEIRKEDYVNNASSTYHLKTGKIKGNIRDVMKYHRLFGHKHIPHNYLICSRVQRLELLAGVLDSDGHYSHNGYDIVLQLKELSEQVTFLARSLGFACYMNECRKTCCNNGKVGTYYRMYISGEVSGDTNTP